MDVRVISCDVLGPVAPNESHYRMIVVHNWRCYQFQVDVVDDRYSETYRHPQQVPSYCVITSAGGYNIARVHLASTDLDPPGPYRHLPRLDTYEQSREIRSAIYGLIAGKRENDPPSAKL